MACDLDGTLLRDDLTISDRTRAALARVEAAGSLAVLVTGRPPRWMHPVADQTDHRGLAICANGALLYDLHTERVVAAHLISPETLAASVDLLRELLPGAAFAVEYGTEFAHEETYAVAENHRRPEIRAVPGSELLTRPAAKLLVQHAERGSNDLLAATRGVLGELVEVTHSTPTGPGLLEVSAAGITKATALARLCAAEAIHPSEVVAFGDMPNDLPMLAWAGHAYAMANGHPDVLAACALHAPSNADDGVAAVLERWFA